MHILITGSSGFIGSNLIPYLKEQIPGITISLVGRKKDTGINKISWNELKSSSFDGIDAVIHLAGLAHDTKNTVDEEAYYDVNFELTKYMYDCYLDSEATKFVYVSSVKAVTDKVEGVLTEEITPNPITAYGKSKLKAEEYIEISKQEGKDYYILRPCMVHGPNNKGNLNLFYKFVKKGFPYPLGAYNNSRSFLAIDNFCYVIEKLLLSKVESGVYNISDDDSLSTQELFEIIAEAAGKKAKIWNVSKGMIDTIAKFGDILKLPVNTERLDKLTENYVVDNAKLKKALGIAKLPTDTKQGIMRTVASFEDDV